MVMTSGDSHPLVLLPQHIKSLLILTVTGACSLHAAPALCQLGSPTPTDYWRMYQAHQAASDYYRYARKQQQTSGYSQYGHYGPNFERIDNVLAKNQQHFTDYDIADLSNRITSLKQRISSCVAQGFDTRPYQDDMANLEAEVNRKVDDSLLTINTIESHLNETLDRVEQLISANKSKMAESDYEELENRIKRLRNRSTRDQLVSHGVGSHNYKSDFAEEASKIESAIIGKSLFHRSAESNRVEPASASFSGDGRKPISASPTSNDPGVEPKESRSFHTGGLTSYRITPGQPRQPAPPVPTLAKVFENTENRLLDLHEAERLGTFDIDIFTERMLKLKYNCKKLVGKTGKLSPRQEAWIRAEMDKLNEDISERGHSSE